MKTWRRQAAQLKSRWDSADKEQKSREGNWILSAAEGWTGRPRPPILLGGADPHGLAAGY